MTEKDERFCDNWKWTRKRGRNWFIIRFTLILGLGVTALHFLNIWGCECDTLFVKYSGTILLKNILKEVLATLLAMFLVGSLLGWVIWDRNESRFKRLNG